MLVCITLSYTEIVEQPSPSPDQTTDTESDVTIDPTYFKEFSFYPSLVVKIDYEAKRFDMEKVCIAISCICFYVHVQFCMRNLLNYTTLDSNCQWHYRPEVCQFFELCWLYDLESVNKVYYHPATFIYLIWY